MTALLDLAARVERLSEPSEAVFEEAFWAVNPNYADPRRFRELLDAKAWLDAALTLVPERLFPRLYCELAQAILVAWTDTVGWEEMSRSAICHTPALALTAAVLRAQAAQVQA